MWITYYNFKHINVNHMYKLYASYDAILCSFKQEIILI